LKQAYESAYLRPISDTVKHDRMVIPDEALENAEEEIQLCWTRECDRYETQFDFEALKGTRISGA